MIPDLVVMAPADGEELRAMTHLALLYEDGPIALRFPRGAAQAEVELGKPPPRLELGKGEIVREGEEICLVGIGTMVGHAIEAADLLEAEGIRVSVAQRPLLSSRWTASCFLTPPGATPA